MHELCSALLQLQLAGGVQGVYRVSTEMAGVQGVHAAGGTHRVLAVKVLPGNALVVPRPQLMPNAKRERERQQSRQACVCVCVE